MIIRRRFRCRSINTCLAIFFQIITCRCPSAQGFRICTSLIGFQRSFIPIRPFCITILSNSFLKSRITSFVIRFIFIIIRFFIRPFTTVLQASTNVCVGQFPPRQFSSPTGKLYFSKELVARMARQPKMSSSIAIL